MPHRPYEMIEISRSNFDDLISTIQHLNESLELLVTEHHKLQATFFDQSTRLAVSNARVENTALVEEELYYRDIECKDLRCQLADETERCNRATGLLTESMEHFKALKQQFDLYVSVHTKTVINPNVEE